MMATGDGDIISSLPDEVLCHILSFLPTKYSVRTRLLSTRWKHLFTFVPNLNFNLCSGNAKTFIDFVNFVFALYNVSRMNKFNLQYRVYKLPVNFPICWWISSAIFHRVQEIHIDVDSLSSVRLTMPRHLFISKTLTTLELHGCNLVLPTSVCLPCLRACVLGRVCFDDDSANRLFRSCPALQDLYLNESSVAQGVKRFDITSPTLKHLYIHDLNNVYQLVLNVPNLLRFEYSGPPPMDEFLGLESLKTVIDAYIFCETISRDSVVVEFVRAFCHVQKLTLFWETMEAFIRSGHSLPKFNNLTSLRFLPISSRSWMFLPNLLDNSPRLEFLSLYYEDIDGDVEDDRDNYIFPERVPSCVSLHLKEVEFQYFFTLDYDRKLINYFLKYAKNLKKMKITSNLRWKKKQSSEQFEVSSAEIVFQRDGGELVHDDDDEDEV